MRLLDESPGRVVGTPWDVGELPVRGEQPDIVDPHVTGQIDQALPTCGRSARSAGLLDWIRTATRAVPGHGCAGVFTSVATGSSPRAWKYADLDLQIQIRAAALREGDQIVEGGQESARPTSATSEVRRR